MLEPNFEKADGLGIRKGNCETFPWKTSQSPLLKS